MSTNDNANEFNFCEIDPLTDTPFWNKKGVPSCINWVYFLQVRPY